MGQARCRVRTDGPNPWARPAAGSGPMVRTHGPDPLQGPDPWSEPMGQARCRVRTHGPGPFQGPDPWARAAAGSGRASSHPARSTDNGTRVRSTGGPAISGLWSAHNIITPVDGDDHHITHSVDMATPAAYTGRRFTNVIPVCVCVCVCVCVLRVN